MDQLTSRLFSLCQNDVFLQSNSAQKGVLFARSVSSKMLYTRTCLKATAKGPVTVILSYFGHVTLKFVVY